jgi:hypothetical protein
VLAVRTTLLVSRAGDRPLTTKRFAAKEKNRVRYKSRSLLIGFLPSTLLPSLKAFRACIILVLCAWFFLSFVAVTAHAQSLPAPTASGSWNVRKAQLIRGIPQMGTNL